MAEVLLERRSQELALGKSLHDILFGRLTICLSFAALVASFLLPPDGAGITVCWFKGCFGLPCPGCGLTRSLTSLSQLEFSKAFAYHPFGFLIYTVFVANLIRLCLPWRTRVKLRRFLECQTGGRRMYQATVSLFIGYGLIRLALTYFLD